MPIQLNLKRKLNVSGWRPVAAVGASALVAATLVTLGAAPDLARGIVLRRGRCLLLLTADLHLHDGGHGHLHRSGWGDRGELRCVRGRRWKRTRVRRSGAPGPGAPGGLGGETRGTVVASPGQVFQITVGKAGISGSSTHGVPAQPGGVGHGTGGDGGHGGAGSGGGGTDVRVGAFTGTDRVLVAGGGGGAGNGGPLPHGGDGGGLVGADGGQGGGPAGSGDAGTGGTQTDPGTGTRPTSGVGGPGIPGGPTDPVTSQPTAGSGGHGGNGGGGSGGNPGGYFGAGGGGGSGFASPSATDVALISGVNHGNGKVIVSFRFGTSTQLTASPPAPLFGRPVTVTVNPTNPRAGPPSGTVTFSDGATLLATVPLTAGQGSFTTTKLQPGNHPITASYSGDQNFLPSATAGPTDVTVQPGGALAVSGAEVTGHISTDGAGGIETSTNTITGLVQVTNNSGSGLLPEDAIPEFETNHVDGLLTCTGNTPTLTQSGNTVTGLRLGQCQ